MTLTLAGAGRSILLAVALAAPTLAITTCDALAAASSYSGASNDGVMIEGFVVWVIILTPLVMLLARLRINPDATRLHTGLRRWNLRKVTGRLISYRSHTSTHGSGGHSVGNTIAPVHIGTDLHENLRLELPGNKLWDTELVNFNFSPTVGDVITICLGSRGGAERILAALNHTTSSWSVNSQELFAMGTGGGILQSIKVMAMIFFMIFCLIMSILGNQPAIFVWGLVPFGIWLLRARRMGRFANVGGRQLLAATSAEARALMASSPSAAG